MKLYTLVFILFASLHSCKSELQHFEKSESNVVFVLSEGKNGNYQTKTIFNKNIIEPLKSDTRYKFFFINDDNDSNKNRIITLIYSQFLNFDDKEENNPTAYFKVNKSFIRKNKDIILTNSRMLELGYKKTYKLLSNAKHILLIDKNEIENNKIIIKEVLFFFDRED